MTREPSGRRWLSITAATAACLALSCMLGAVVLPSLLRSRERRARLGRVKSLRIMGDATVSRPRRMFLRQRTVRLAGGARVRGPWDELGRLGRTGLGLASWASVGGCGVGGGGGGTVRWIGRRAPGGLVEYEMLSSQSVGEDLNSQLVTIQATGDIPGRLNVGVSVPFKYNIRDVDYQDDPLEVGGVGDVSLLASRPFGIEGDVTANLTVTLPSAEYKRYDGVLTTTTRYYPYDAQLGTGVATFDLQVERSLDQDWGPIIVGGGYTYSGGENDIGDLRGDALAAFCYVGYRTEMAVWSAGLNLSYALTKDKEQGAEVLDQDLLLVSLQGGVEFSFQRVPVFLALVGTMGERTGLVSTTLALGLVAAF